MFIQKTFRTFLALAAVCLFLGACDDDDGVGPKDQAIVRFVNAMTGTTDELTLRANGALVGNGADYQEAGSCTGLVPGNTDLAVTTAGSATALASLSNQNLESGTRYTIVASGSVLDPDLTLFKDTYTSPTNGRARLRVLNAVGPLSPFDVYVGTPGSALGTPNDVNVGFNSTRDFLDVPEGTTQVRATTPGLQTVIGTSANINLNEGNVRTLFFTPSSTVGGTFTSFLVSGC